MITTISRLTKNGLHYIIKNNVRMMSSASDIVITEEIGKSAGVITLNRQKALNAINLEMVHKIYAPLKSWENVMKLVIIKGAGEKSFCAGGDVRTLIDNGLCQSSIDFFRYEYTMNHLIGTYRIPYIAILDGITMGGGVGLSVHGRYRVATERTMFAMPETVIGLFPDVGGSHFLPRLRGSIGLYLGLTGFRLKGKDVLKCGIATHYCPSDKLPELEKELISNANTADDVDRILSKFCPIDNSPFILDPHLEQINKHFGGDSVESIIKSLENDKSDWAAKTLQTLQKMSPLSMKTTFHQLKLGSQLDLANCLKMEFTMAIRHLENSDFAEGVRALLVDKDNKPKWNPKTLAEVTQERVEFFFKPYPNEELKLERTLTIKSKL